MDSTVEQLEAEIDRTREHLGADLHELERKVDSAMDWRRYYEARMVPVLSVAFASGVALAFLAGHRQQRRLGMRDDDARSHSPTQNAWDEIRRALVTVAATRLTDYLAGC
jgi:hypothetical protein